MINKDGKFEIKKIREVVATSLDTGEQIFSIHYPNEYRIRPSDIVFCEFYRFYHEFEEGFKDCRHPHGLDAVMPDSFCSYGIRRLS